MAAGAALALLVLGSLGLLAPRPAWFFPAVIAAALAIVVVTDRVVDGRGHVTLRIAGQVVATTVIIYAAGWGPALGVGYLFVLTENVQAYGSRVALRSVLLAGIAIAAGQAAITCGLAPTLLDTRLSHGLAVLVVVGLAFVGVLLRDAVATGEQGLDLMKTSLATMERRATHDAVTDLPNGTTMLARVEELGSRGDVALVLVDLDGFRHINDALGRTVGDELLRTVGRRFRAIVDESDLVARPDSDMFAVVASADATCAFEIAETLQRELREPVEVGDATIHLTASVGFVVGHAMNDAPRLFGAASSALDIAKRRGGGRIEEAEPPPATVVAGRLRLASELRSALAHGGLDVAYQPIVELSSGAVVGAEALSRWNHPEGPVAPDIFIPIAEETGLIHNLGETVLAKAAGQAARWDLPVSVNVSARQLFDPAFPDRVASLLAVSGLPSSRLTIELTETVLVEDCPETNVVMRALAELGVRIAIDDFGAGYAGLQYLQRFNTSQIKIDRSLIDHVDARPRQAALVRGVIDMARSLEIEVLAEGIEREAERDMLWSLGCQYAQGWLFGRPVPAAQFPVPALDTTTRVQ